MGDKGDWLSDGRGRRLPHGSWPATRTAPAGLETVRQFLNTRNPHTGADILATVGEVRAWLAERGLPSGRLDAAAVDVIHHLRDTLLALAIANGDDVPAEEAWRDLTALAERFPVTLTFGSGVAVRSVQPGWPAAVVTVIQAVGAAHADGTWWLLKACRDPTCRWVVFDRSKNRSVSWCSAGTCGGRARAKAYRAKLRSR